MQKFPSKNIFCMKNFDFFEKNEISNMSDKTYQKTSKIDVPIKNSCCIWTAIVKSTSPISELKIDVRTLFSDGWGVDLDGTYPSHAYASPPWKGMAPPMEKYKNVFFLNKSYLVQPVDFWLAGQ